MLRKKKDSVNGNSYSSGLGKKVLCPSGQEGNSSLQPLFDGTVSNYICSEVLNSQTLFFSKGKSFRKTLLRRGIEGENFLTVSATASVQGRSAKNRPDKVHTAIGNSWKFNCTAV